jgi:RNA polymerase sigma factor (sigma-70 family)
MNKSTVDDKVIISGLQAGGTQRHSFETKLYNHFKYLIKGGVWRRRLPEETCQSVYSDTVMDVIENIVTRRFEGKASLKAYIYQIFDHKCVDEVRKNTTNKNAVNEQAVGIETFTQILPDSTRSVIEEIIRKETLDGIRERLLNLGENCRQILSYFGDGYTDIEIAQMTGFKTAEVVKTTRLRCLDKLRARVLNKKSND